VPISSGGPGQETPIGNFNVQWKDKNHKSQEFKLPNGQGAPMLWSVFWGTVALPFTAVACAALRPAAYTWPIPTRRPSTNTLQLGDAVEVH